MQTLGGAGVKIILEIIINGRSMFIWSLIWYFLEERKYLLESDAISFRNSISFLWLGLSRY